MKYEGPGSAIAKLLPRPAYLFKGNVLIKERLTLSLVISTCGLVIAFPFYLNFIPTFLANFVSLSHQQKHKTSNPERTKAHSGFQVKTKSR